MTLSFLELSWLNENSTPEIFLFIQISDELAVEFRAAIHVKYGSPDGKNKGLTQAIDKFQTHFECCGFNSYLDWKSSNYTKTTGSIPHSCCKRDMKKDPKCGKPSPDSMTVYEKKVFIFRVVFCLNSCHKKVFTIILLVTIFCTLDNLVL